MKSPIYIFCLCILFSTLSFGQVKGHNVTLVQYPGGNFTQSSKGYWTEQNTQNDKFEFFETGRDEWSVYLLDKSRNISVQLDLYRKEVFMNWERPTRTKLYNIVSVNSATPKPSTQVQAKGHNVTLIEYPGGNFAQTSQGYWTEQNAQNIKFNFFETGRDEWSVYLLDKSRNISIQMDLYRKEIFMNWELPTRIKLYNIVAASSNIPKPSTGVIEFPGTTQKYNISQLQSELKKGGLVLVQTTEIRPGQCVMVYPNADVNDISAKFGLLMCATQIGDNVSLNTTAVYGGCDVSNISNQGIGSKCEAGVGSSDLNLYYNGGKAHFNVKGPNVGSCASISTERLCANAGVTLASSSFEVTDDRGNGLGIGISKGFGAGLDGGYEDGIIHGSIDIKFIAGGSISFSFNPEDFGNEIIKAGKTGYVLFNSGIAAASNEVLNAFSLPGVRSSTGKIVKITGSSVDFIDGGFQDIGNAITTAVYDINSWWVTATKGKRPRRLVSGEGYVSVFNQAGYVTDVSAKYYYENRWYSRSERISAGFTKEFYFPPGATNIGIQTKGIATIDKLKMNLSFPASNNLKRCYKCWGTIFDVEWDEIGCN